MLANLWYLGEIFERLGVFTSCVEFEQRQSWNLLESGSFNIYKNTVVLIIVILGYLKINTEVLDTGMKTAGSDDCREILEDNKNGNSMLAIIQKRARFSHKDGQNFINLFA